MHRIVLILLGVLFASFLLTAMNVMIKQGITFPESLRVAACTYYRVTVAYLSGRWNTHIGLMMTQCLSDKV